ncbi:condensin complex subunit 3 [Kluyveromyces marxianus]|uniref:Condensin complex subunit 3 n=1 Tax=Kluyveromyces marxianus TaxID=4911 RepID=A0ABX6EWL0_KLUMA|nr:condensin complex subunit 3 [Kluyveromyces marxianus]
MILSRDIGPSQNF